jgi:uncharacterized protein YbbK (DUF523 family)
MIVVSACLAGIKCRFDGKTKAYPKVVQLVKAGKAIPVCPEQLGGLATPRPWAEQQGKRVVNKEGKDVTREYRRGAKEALKIAQMAGCKKAILKTKSPACGKGQIYDGSFSGKLIKGEGIFTQLLRKTGIKTLTEKELEQGRV